MFHNALRCLPHACAVSEALSGYSRMWRAKLGNGISEIVRRYAPRFGGCSAGITYAGLTASGDPIPCVDASAPTSFLSGGRPYIIRFIMMIMQSMQRKLTQLRARDAQTIDLTSANCDLYRVHTLYQTLMTKLGLRRIITRSLFTQAARVFSASSFDS